MTFSNQPSNSQPLDYEQSSVMIEQLTPVSPSFNGPPLEGNNTVSTPSTASSFNFDPEATQPTPIVTTQNIPSIGPVLMPAVSSGGPIITPAPSQAEFGRDEFDALKSVAQVATSALMTPGINQSELAHVFEGFARVLNGEVVDNAQELADKNAENAQLKALLLEAQETIITLLNDRVFDRASIARLESEIKLLPDLQSQASRAMGLAMKSEDLQQELSSVRAEVERLRTAYIKTEKKSWFKRLLGQ